MNDLIQSSFDYAALPAATAMTTRAAAERIKLRLKRTVEDIIEIGRDLTAVKADLPHGQFLPWIAAEFEMSHVTATQFMNVADRFGGQILNNLIFKPTVLYALAAPSTPDTIIEKAIEKAESGEKVTVADVKDWKAELEVEKQRTEEFRQESNERRKKVRELEEKIDLLTIRDRMMQDRLEQANQEINHLATVVPEPEKVVVAPEDYEHLKQTERDLRSDLAELKQQQRELVQQQVVAKLKERESELAEIDRKVQRAESLLTGLQTQIDRYSMQQRELKVHLDTIESARVSMAVLAANLEGFGEVIDRDHELRQWHALADMLRNGAAAIEHFVGNTKPALSVIRGEAA